MYFTQVDPSYEPSEKYPFPVLTRVDPGRSGGGSGLLPGAVDDWEGLAGVVNQAHAASRMTMVWHFSRVEFVRVD